MLRAAGIQICFGITFPVHRQGYMLYALWTSHPTYKLGISFGHSCNTLHKESPVMYPLSMPSLNLFSCGCLTGCMQLFYGLVISLINYFCFCNCHFTKLDSRKFKNYNPNSLILCLSVQEQTAWKFTSAQCQGSLVNSSLEYLTSINVQPKATYKHPNTKGNWIGLKTCDQQLHTCNWKRLKKQKHLQWTLKANVSLTQALNFFKLPFQVSPENNKIKLLQRKLIHHSLRHSH
jgi:hypothetical protein